MTRILPGVGPRSSSLKRGPNSKPLNFPSASASANKSRKQTFLFMATMLISALLFTVAISGRRHTLVARKVEKGGRSSNDLIGDLVVTPEFCAKAEAIKVCSHQIINAPPTGRIGPQATLEPPPDGSSYALEALYQAGIECFDIDVVTLKDGTLLAAHPSRFAARVGTEKKPEEYTLFQARKAGADEVGFPVLKDVMHNFATLRRKSKGAPFYSKAALASSDKIPALQGPLLNIDLKGPNLTKQHLKDIEDLVKRRHITENVALCATALDDDGEVGPGIDMLEAYGNAGEHSTLFGLVLRDLVEKDRDVSRIKGLLEKYTGIKAFVPSHKFSSDFFDSLSTLGLPITAWTVDDDAGLIDAVNKGLSAVISNHPIQLRKKLFRIRRQKCGQPI